MTYTMPSSFSLGIAVILLCNVVMAAPVTILDNGLPSNRINLVFVGDGYTQAELDAGTYEAHVQRSIDYMFAPNQQPLLRYRNFFNTYRIDLASAESGADNPREGIYRDTALDSTYWTNGIERLLSADFWKILDVFENELTGTVLSWNDVEPIVAVNDAKYGGSGVMGIYSVFAAANEHYGYLAFHETCHSFALLEDEYFSLGDGTYTGGEPAAVNITTNPDPTTVKWSNWIGYVDPDHPGLGPIGVYEGADSYEYGIYRPTEYSVMGNYNELAPNDDVLNAVCREEWILEIYDRVDPLDDWLENSLTLTDPASIWVDTVDPDVINVEWLVDGQPIADQTGETLSLTNLGLAIGNYTITAHAYDNMIEDWIRRDFHRLQESVTWNVSITVVPEPGTLSFVAVGLFSLLLTRRRSI